MLCMVVVHATMPNHECDSNTILLVDSSESKYIQHDKNIYPEVHEPALPIQHDKNIYPEVHEPVLPIHLYGHTSIK